MPAGTLLKVVLPLADTAAAVYILQALPLLLHPPAANVPLSNYCHSPLPAIEFTS